MSFFKKILKNVLRDGEVKRSPKKGRDARRAERGPVFTEPWDDHDSATDTDPQADTTEKEEEKPDSIIFIPERPKIVEVPQVHVPVPDLPCPDLPCPKLPGQELPGQDVKSVAVPVTDEVNGPESALDVPTMIPLSFTTTDVPNAKKHAPADVCSLQNEVQVSFDRVYHFLEKELKDGPSSLIWSDRVRRGQRVLRLEPEEPILNHPVWFLGDVHGDLLAFETAVNYIQTYSREAELAEPVIVLLGDLVDRFPYGYEVVFRLIERVSRGERFLWLRGNHDEIVYKSELDCFMPDVTPSDFCDWLNDDILTDTDYHENAKKFSILLAQLIPSLPVAVWFPDGTFATHGAFPHRDRVELIETWPDLSQEIMLEDFVWKRLHPTKRTTAVNRNSKSSQVGIQEFRRFCDVMKTKLDSPVVALIRGHDHFPERYKYYEKYAPELVLTINTMCCTIDGCDPCEQSDYETPPVVVQYKPGRMPDPDSLSSAEGSGGDRPTFTVHRLLLDRDTVRSWYPLPPNEAVPPSETTPENTTPSANQLASVGKQVPPCDPYGEKIDEI